MDNPLATYLADHLSGATNAIELLKNMSEKHSHDALGAFASNLLSEIEADRQILQGLAQRVGSASTAKELAAWIAEKASRVKLSSDDGLGMLETLEFLGLGIHGKWALWRALSTVAPTDPRLQGIDYEQLAARAQTQEAMVEEKRLQAARAALTSRAA
jgi:hypothetical protein